MCACKYFMCPNLLSVAHFVTFKAFVIDEGLRSYLINCYHPVSFGFIIGTFHFHPVYLFRRAAYWRHWSLENLRTGEGCSQSEKSLLLTKSARSNYRINSLTGNCLVPSKNTNADWNTGNLSQAEEETQRRRRCVGSLNVPCDTTSP